MIPSFKTGVLLYKATRDGFNSAEFHYRCDNQTNTVTIIKNNLNFVFGGFTAARWSSTAGFIADADAFIFSLRRNAAPSNYKLMVLSSDNAIFGYSSYGPTFGIGWDIMIGDQSNSITGSNSQIFAYTQPAYPSGSDRKTFLAGSQNNWLTTEIEVYQIFK